jgi:hypothetical protein
MFGRSRRKKPQPIVVLWWPNGDEPVPEVAGPYVTPEEALDVRNEIRRSQRRTLNPAQVVPLTLLAFPTQRRSMRRNGSQP